MQGSRAVRIDKHKVFNLKGLHLYPMIFRGVGSGLAGRRPDEQKADTRHLWLDERATDGKVQEKEERTCNDPSTQL